MTKKIILILFLAILYKMANGQSINLTTDSLSKLLCRKWQTKYATVNGMNIGKGLNSTNMTYTFNEDKTFFIETSGTINKGIWEYDKKAKKIKLYRLNVNRMNIIAIDENLFDLTIGVDNPKEHDPPKMHIFFSPTK